MKAQEFADAINNALAEGKVFAGCNVDEETVVFGFTEPENQPIDRFKASVTGGEYEAG